MLMILLGLAFAVLLAAGIALALFIRKTRKDARTTAARKAAKDRKLRADLQIAEVEYVVKQIDRELDKIREAGEERDLERGTRLSDLKKLLKRVVENDEDTLSLGTVCDRAVGAFSPPAGSQRVDLDLAGANAGGPVVGEAALLEWAVGELLANVVQHGGEWSTIRLRLRETGESVVLTLEDDGDGPDVTAASRLYGPFTPRTDSGGPGLGLFVVFRIVLRMGGTIDATRSPEGGLAHEIRLPRAPAIPKRQSG